METKIQEYKDLLKKHNWFYDYSDNHGVYTRGSNSIIKIDELAKDVDPNYEIYNEFAPDQFKIKR